MIFSPNVQDVPPNLVLFGEGTIASPVVCDASPNLAREGVRPTCTVWMAFCVFVLLILYFWLELLSGNTKRMGNHTKWLAFSFLSFSLSFLSSMINIKAEKSDAKGTEAIHRGGKGRCPNEVCLQMAGSVCLRGLLRNTQLTRNKAGRYTPAYMV